MMSSQRKCEVCGAIVPRDAPGGACPTCALESALLPGPSDTVAGDLDQGLANVHYFGDYELVEEIARGGMGIVYRARQVSLNRMVALKMILAGRLASDSEVKRFQHEAQAAANLHHPNIVAVYEVGVHEGQYYYSMEFIEGRNLAELAREQPLPASLAAQHVRTVAEAIDFAHQRGTLHRDLKPTNILIDIFDQPRITDFGLARCGEADPHLTATGQIVGTPAFMSPEQASGRTEAVGPHSDVYSTGAVLYYLLTQRPPFGAPSLPDLLALVVGQEPVSPRALNPGVPRDLETICLKCLEKEPSRRYASARALAEELGRFNRGEPILARPVSLPEKVWRWRGRNPALAGSIAATALILLVGVFASTWQAVRATRAEREEAQMRRQAEAAHELAANEANRAHEVAQFLKDMLAGIDPETAKGRDTTLVREILDRTNARIGSSLKNDPEAEADLRRTLGNVYHSLGDYTKAEMMHRKALELKKNARKESADIAPMLNELAMAIDRGGRAAEAETNYRQALVLFSKPPADHSPELKARTLSNLGNVLWRQARLSEAEKAYREALSILTNLVGMENKQVAGILGNLAMLAGSRGNPAEAESLFRQVLVLQKKLLGEDNPVVAQTLNNLAIPVGEQGRLEEAESLHKQSLALRRKILPGDHPDLAITINNLADLLVAEGKLDEAEKLHREALAIRRKRFGDNHSDTALSLNNLGNLLMRQKRFAESEAALREALAIRRKIWGENHRDVPDSLTALGEVLVEEGNLNDAEAMYREALGMYRKVPGVPDPDLSTALNNLAIVLEKEGKRDEAKPLYDEAVSLGSRRLRAVAK
jgi:serine/threonine protein kinase/Flp pilus assembly protein TadD